MIVTIHQPEHLPWLGFLHKAELSDILVLLDNVQFRKNYFQNRNKIRTVDGSIWLTVPVKKHNLNTHIQQIEINNSQDWRKKYIKTLEMNYQPTQYFNDYFPSIKTIIESDCSSLADLNTALIRQLFEFFNIRTEIVIASQIDDSLNGAASDLLLSICKELKADTYLSGISGRDYLNTGSFDEAQIDIEYQEFYHPVYKQRYEPFEPCMSSVDLLFNCGEESHQMLMGEDSKRLEYVFE